MTYVKQLEDYEEAVMRKRLEEMPESGEHRTHGRGVGWLGGGGVLPFGRGVGGVGGGWGGCIYHLHVPPTAHMSRATSLLLLCLVVLRA